MAKAIGGKFRWGEPQIHCHPSSVQLKAATHHKKKRRRAKHLDSVAARIQATINLSVSRPILIKRNSLAGGSTAGATAVSGATSESGQRSGDPER